MPLGKSFLFEFFFLTTKFRLPLSSRGEGGGYGLNGTALIKKTFLKIYFFLGFVKEPTNYIATLSSLLISNFVSIYCAP